MTTHPENPADAVVQELARLYPDEGCARMKDPASLRPLIATMEAKPQHPQVMDAALTGTADMLTGLFRSLREHFADAHSSWEDGDNPDWVLVKAVLDRLLDSDFYLKLAESHAVALRATDTGDGDAHAAIWPLSITWMKSQ